MCKLYTEGVEISALCEIFNVRASTIHYHTSSLDVKKRNKAIRVHTEKKLALYKDNASLDNMVELAKLGVSRREIAETYKLSIAYVNGLISKHLYDTRYKRLSSESTILKDVDVSPFFMENYTIPPIAQERAVLYMMNKF
jgi:hypothetical protein